MIIIGCDFHPSWQQICWLDKETGETAEQKLVHASGDAQKFYQHLAAPALIGMEATGNCQWFVEMVKAAGHEVWIGDAARIRASDVRQQKHDRRDAALLLQLLLEGRFPRIWTPSSEQRDLRQLLIHRYKLVRLRAQAKNGLQHLAMNQGLQKKRRLWSEAGQKLLRALPLQPWASRRREDLFSVMELLDQKIALLDLAVREAAEKDANARLLMTQPGVGPVTSLAFVLTMGDVTRFARGKQVASYLGLIPREYSSGGHQRLGSISKQGKPVYEDAVGGSGASRGALRSADEAGIFASLSPKAERSGEGGRGAQVGPTTLLDAAHAKAVSGDRFDREQLAGAPGRPSQRIDRRVDWALSPRYGSGFGWKNHGRGQGRIDGW